MNNQNQSEHRATVTEQLFCNLSLPIKFCVEDSNGCIEGSIIENELTFNGNNTSALTIYMVSEILSQFLESTLTEEELQGLEMHRPSFFE